MTGGLFFQVDAHKSSFNYLTPYRKTSEEKFQTFLSAITICANRATFRGVTEFVPTLRAPSQLNPNQSLKIKSFIP